MEEVSGHPWWPLTSACERMAPHGHYFQSGGAGYRCSTATSTPHVPVAGAYPGSTLRHSEILNADKRADAIILALRRSSRNFFSNKKTESETNIPSSG